MANTPSAVVIPARQSVVVDTADAKTRWRIRNSTAGDLFVRLAAATARSHQGGYDLAIPAGLSYFSDLNEYAGEIRAFSEGGGTINYSKDV